MGSFESGEQQWTEQFDNLRNTIRQELIGRQLVPWVDAGMTVLDVGCGQGTQGLRLARRGCRVTGVDASAALLGLFARDAAAAGLDVELIEGTVDDLDALLGDRTFDLVCAHGLVMYLDDRAEAIRVLSRRLAEPHGRLSITFRNGDALALRPGLRRDWAAALAAFDATSYLNELGVDARADRLDEVRLDLAAAGLDVVEWYGVHALNDAIPAAMAVPDDPDEMALLLDAEDQAGRRDPYRGIASQTHVIAQRPSSEPLATGVVINDLGQPVGRPLPPWTPPPRPDAEVLSGRWARLERLDLARHGDSLWREYAVDTDNRMWTYLPLGPFADQAAFAAAIAGLATNGDMVFYALVDPSDAAAIGLLAYLRIEPRAGSIEVGAIMLSPRAQRTRLSTEAIFLMADHVFSLGYRRFEWKCDSLNGPSRQAATRFGFVYEGTFRQAMVNKGRNRDTAWFAMVDGDWPRLRAAFVAWLAPENFDDDGHQRTRLAAAIR